MRLLAAAFCNMSWLKRRVSEPVEPGGRSEAVEPPPSPARKNTKTCSSSPAFDPQHIRNGKILEVFLDDLVRQLIQAGKTPSNPKNNETRVHTVAEVCAGSCVSHCASAELNRSFRRWGIPHRFKTLYICELSDMKRNFGTDVIELDQVEGEETEDFCTFKDLCHLHKLVCECSRHKGKSRKKSRASAATGAGLEGCPVPATEGIIGGISCKDLSKGNQNKGKMGNPLDPAGPPKTGGSSWSTFYGLLWLIDAHGQDCPDWIAIENVDELVTSRDEEIIDVVLSELSARGYECIYFFVNSVDWAIPQERKRVFIIGLQVVYAKHIRFSKVSIDMVFRHIKDTFASARRRSPCLTSVLLDDDDLRVTAARAEWMEHEPKGWDSPTLKAHLRYWQDKGMRLGEFEVDPNTKKSVWYKHCNARDKDALAGHQHQRKDEAACYFAGDISQSVGRVPHSSLHSTGAVVTQTILPGSVIYLSEYCDPDMGAISFERLMLGSEALALGAMPIFHPRFQPLFEKYGERQMMTLGGNMFAGTIIGGLLASVIFELPWNPDLHDDQREEIEEPEAMAAMDLLASLIAR